MYIFNWSADVEVVGRAKSDKLKLFLKVCFDKPMFYVALMMTPSLNLLHCAWTHWLASAQQERLQPVRQPYGHRMPLSFCPCYSY